jgi:uncharacterized protein (DUF1778 family)
VHKIRSRLINFRVTEEEFDQLKSAAALKGSRCLSEFARLIMLGTDGAHFPGDQESVDGKLSIFDQRLNVLESSVARLMDALSDPGHSR